MEPLVEACFTVVIHALMLTANPDRADMEEQPRHSMNRFAERHDLTTQRCPLIDPASSDILALEF